MSWYAAYTRPNHERVVDKLLRDKGIGTFLPKVIVPSRRRDRKILIKRPLFPNYLFVELNQARGNWMKVFRTPGLVRICGNERPMPVPDEDIESIRIFVNGDRNIYPLSYLQVGSKVQVISGPLAGAIGIFVKEDSKKRRLVVSIELMGQSVAASLYDDEVKPY
ncbi:UpxY family transcription antiterminator [candidate division WOR-3 bacterium]|nr:UpxY family transcription antiterminator [candidate division WOR-3 bacterium]